jgi:carbonic anhydrase/acetyltransferase-like protein (isoleucine patch superfamily)
VTEGKEFPDGSLIIGSPAKALKSLSPEQIAEMNRISSHYFENALRYRNGLKKIS